MLAPRDGVRPGMGVLSADGVVGRVKVASEHYATATCVLHSKTSYFSQNKARRH